MTIDMIMDIKPNTAAIIGVSFIVLFVVCAIVVFGQSLGEIRVRTSLVALVAVTILCSSIITYAFHNDQLWKTLYVVPYVADLPVEGSIDVEEFVKFNGDVYALYGDDKEMSIKVTNVRGVEGSLYNTLTIDESKPENYIVASKLVPASLVKGWQDSGGSDVEDSTPTLMEVNWLFEKN